MLTFLLVCSWIILWAAFILNYLADRQAQKICPIHTSRLYQWACILCMVLTAVVLNWGTYAIFTKGAMQRPVYYASLALSFWNTYGLDKSLKAMRAVRRKY